LPGLPSFLSPGYWSACTLATFCRVSLVGRPCLAFFPVFPFLRFAKLPLGSVRPLRPPCSPLRTVFSQFVKRDLILMTSRSFIVCLRTRPLFPLRSCRLPNHIDDGPLPDFCPLLSDPTPPPSCLEIEVRTAGPQTEHFSGKFV